MARKRPGMPTKRTSIMRSRLASGIVGGVLLGLAGIWLGWLFLHQFGGPPLPTLPIAPFAPTAQSDLQITPLVAEGITLEHTNRPATLNKQQALLIGSQLEPHPATSAKSVTAQYILLNYHSKNTNLNSVPAWMILYQRIPLEPADASADPTPFPQSYYDLYVFLDANSGKELLLVQV